MHNVRYSVAVCCSAIFLDAKGSPLTAPPGKAATNHQCLMRQSTENNWSEAKIARKGSEG